MGEVRVIEHPLVQHKLTLMRRTETTTLQFRTLMREVSLLLAYEATRDLPIVEEAVRTPLAEMSGTRIEGRKLVLAPVLRAGLGMLDGFLDLIPAARVGHVGMYRDEETLEPVEYYFKMPQWMEERDVLVIDPMLATGNSAAAAVSRAGEATQYSDGLPAGGPRGHRKLSPPVPRGAGHHSCDRQPSQRARLHRSRAG